MHPSNLVALIKSDQNMEVELCCRKLTLDQDASKVSSYLVEAIQEVNVLVKDIALANNRMSGAA